MTELSGLAGIPAGPVQDVLAEIAARINTRATEATMGDMAALFPCLKDAPGVRPWDPSRLDSWASSGVPDHGTVAAVRFLLAVWNGSEDTWKAGAFRLANVGDMDQASRAIVAAWVRSPFWL